MSPSSDPVPAAVNRSPCTCDMCTKVQIFAIVQIPLDTFLQKDIDGKFAKAITNMWGMRDGPWCVQCGGVVDLRTPKIEEMS